MLVSILILFTACHGEESEMMASDGPINLRGPVNLRETAQNDSDAFRFLVIADWGKYNGNGNRNEKSLTAKMAYQTQVAKAMAIYASSSEPPCSFIAALGDNFYDNGVQSADDSRWEYVWKDVYHGAYSSLSMPWYSVFGNHDYGYGASGVQAQIDRSESNYDDDLWNMPSTNYSKVFAIGDTGETVHIVFIDTTTLAPSENPCCNEKSGISTSEQQQRIENQIFRIKAMLDEALLQDPTWLIVVGHYPIYSGGPHGDTKELLENLQPLLEYYQVHAYFSGHDHVSEHLQMGNIEYFVAGAGSMTDSMKFGSSAPVLWSGAGYCAFATVLATPAELEVQFIDTNNEIVYSYALKNPHLPNGSIADEILIDGAWTASEVTYTVASIVFFMVIISSSLYFFWSAFGGNKSRDIKTKSGETLYDILGPFGEVEADNNKAPYLPSIP